MPITIDDFSNKVVRKNVDAHTYQDLEAVLEAMKEVDELQDFIGELFASIAETLREKRFFGRHFNLHTGTTESLPLRRELKKENPAQAAKFFGTMMKFKDLFEEMPEIFGIGPEYVGVGPFKNARINVKKVGRDTYILECGYGIIVEPFTEEFALQLGTNVKTEYFILAVEFAHSSKGASIDFATFVACINEAFGATFNPLSIAKDFVSSTYSKVLLDMPHCRLEIRGDSASHSGELGYTRKGCRVFVRFNGADSAAVNKPQHSGISLWFTPLNDDFFTDEEVELTRHSVNALKRLFEGRKVIRSRKKRVKAL